jgi:capsular polysaccharide export protein
LKRGDTEPVLDGPVYAHGFSWRKRALVRAFSGRDDVRFVRNGSSVVPGGNLLLWGSAQVPPGLPAAVRIVRLEDGFVRSVGLGADLVRPLSWVLDDVGIYYDARQPSALEQILARAAFPPAELARAHALRKRIVEAGLTKYNLASSPWQHPSGAREVVLVAGQVETDASIAGGFHEIRTNLALLKAAREAKPHAWLVYKPHPDVVAGLRDRGDGEERAQDFCDEIVLQGSMHDLILQVDEVHVLTSLAGFEALLRERPVVCWGHPFYAGWGLTQDTAAHPRRTRKLSLDELTAGSLLRYPVYIDFGGRRCAPEEALNELLRWRDKTTGAPTWPRRWLRPLLKRR